MQVEGIRFVRESHMQIAEGIYLPRADLLGYLSNSLHEIVHIRPELKAYMPDLLAVDVFVTWDGDKFMLFISSETRGHLPTRGMETKHLSEQREAGNDLLRNISDFTDISDLPPVKQSFEKIGFSPGFAATGTFPAGLYDPASVAAKERAGKALAELMLIWAEGRRLRVENSRIFLSHKGTNKPFVEKVHVALRLLGLKTWFDKNDLAAGDTLVRGVDNAFAQCSAAVFFVSADYVDAGVIGNEINRAIHEAATRVDGFRIIPLVLAQHGGTDDKIPSPLKTLVWKTVDDVDVVPEILRSLPTAIQDTVRYTTPK
jgi:hypothetical protein